MSNGGPTGAERAVDVRMRARTLREAGWLEAAATLLSEAAGGRFQRDVGIRIDLARTLLAAGRIDEAEAVRLPDPERRQ